MFREGMSKEDLTKALIQSMDHFRPAIAELSRDALRWQFCIDNRFPSRVDRDRWSLTVRLTATGALFTFHGSTAAECVDAAIAQQTHEEVEQVLKNKKDIHQRLLNDLEETKECEDEHRRTD